MKTEPHRPRHGAPAFALVTVLLAVALLVVAGTGFLASARLDRMTARLQLDLVRAEFAAAAAFEEAGGVLARAVRHDAFLVVRAESNGAPCFFIGDADPAVAAPGRMLFTPLVSGAAPVLVSNGAAPHTVFTGPPVRAVPKVLPWQPEASAAWVALADPATGATNARYGFWIEDLAAYIDADCAGNTAGPGGAHRRGEGVDPAEIAAFTVFDPRSPEDATGQDDVLVRNRHLLLAHGAIRGLLDNPAHATNFIANLGDDAEPARIPFGMGYPDAGAPKDDLNALIAARDVPAIAARIARNLPDFAGRGGGMAPPDDYLLTLAACIVDYADADGDATCGAGYRGIDSFPFVNEMFDRYAWVAGAGPEVEIEVTTWVELWNPADARASGTLELLNRNRHVILANGPRRFSDAGPWRMAVDIPPNGFLVAAFPPARYVFDAGRAVASPLWFRETRDSTYELRWNGVRVDTARGGLQRTEGTLRSGQASRKWKGHSAPALDYSRGQCGDPRASWYIASAVFANDYDRNSSWHGRNVRRGIANPDYAAVDIGRWPDPGHNSDAGTAPGSDARLPADLTAPPPQPARAPAHISNTGRLLQITELGHVFDPAQWSGLEARGLPSAASGGGFSLRIGRPEFPRFDRPGTRAAELLDLFATAPARATRGLVNINTATRETLRALAAGLRLARDPALLPPGVPAPNRGAPDQGGAFADAVIACRPFLSTARLAAITNRFGPFFGNPEQWDGRPPIAWSDAAAKECFARIHDLVSVRSRNFRVFIRAEALGADGSQRAAVARVFHVFVRPERDPAGRLIRNHVEVRHVENL